MNKQITGYISPTFQKISEPEYKPLPKHFTLTLNIEKLHAGPVILLVVFLAGTYGQI